MNSNYIMARISALSVKGRGGNSVYGILKHIDKHIEANNISRPELSHLNYCEGTLSYKDVLAKAKDREQQHNKAAEEYNKLSLGKKRYKLHKGANQIFQGVICFSHDLNGELIQNHSKLIETVKSYLKEQSRFKDCDFARLSVDFDEETVHAHFVAVAWNETTKNTSFMKLAGGPEGLSDLQTEIADFFVNRGFNVKRGESRFNDYTKLVNAAKTAYGTQTPSLQQIMQFAADHNITIPKKRHHKTLAEYRKQTEQELADKDKALQEIDDAYFQRQTDVYNIGSEVEQLKAEKRQLKPEVEQLKADKEQLKDLLDTAAHADGNLQDALGVWQLTHYDKELPQNSYEEKSIADSILSDDDFDR